MANIHVIPKFDYSLPMGDKEKRIACVAKRERKMENMRTENIIGLLQINKKDKDTNSTFRKMLMSLGEAKSGLGSLFISLEKSSYNYSQYTARFPKRRADEAKDVLFHCAFLIKRKYNMVDINQYLSHDLAL